jgi:hypothetical protein
LNIKNCPLACQGDFVAGSAARKIRYDPELTRGRRCLFLPLLSLSFGINAFRPKQETKT